MWMRLEEQFGPAFRVVAGRYDRAHHWADLLRRELGHYDKRRTASGHPSGKPRIILSNPETQDNLSGQIQIVVDPLVIGVRLNLCQGHLVSYQLLSRDSCRMADYIVPKEGNPITSVYRETRMQ